MPQHPVLKSMRKEADGWVKKYVLTYEQPDGSLYEYHCATRREDADFAAELERNGRASRTIMEKLHTPRGAHATDGQNDDASTSQDASFSRGAGAAEGSAGSAGSAGAAEGSAGSVMDAPGLGDSNEEEPPFTPDAVCIVARTPRDTLVMEREFRYPLNSWCVALPAGLVDPGEDIATCAARELSEETGYEVLEDTPIYALPQAGYSSTGLTDETVQVVFVEAEKAGDAHTEGTELIEVFELPIADIGYFLATNRLPIGTRAQLVLELVNAMANAS